MGGGKFDTSGLTISDPAFFKYLSTVGKLRNHQRQKDFQLPWDSSLTNKAASASNGPRSCVKFQGRFATLISFLDEIQYNFLKDWGRPRPRVSARFSFGLKNFPVHTLSDSLQIYPIFQSGERIQKMSGCIRTEALCGKKKLRIKKYPDSCGLGLR